MIFQPSRPPFSCTEESRDKKELDIQARVIFPEGLEVSFLSMAFVESFREHLDTLGLANEGL